MDKEFASWASFGAFVWYMKIHETTDLARVALSPEQRRLYCRAAGRVLGFALHDLLEPIYKIHPDLTPEVLRSNTDGSADSTTGPNPEGERKGRMSISDFREEVLHLADAVEMNLRDMISLGRLRCAPEVRRDLEARIGEIMEQVSGWRALVHTGIRGEGE